MEDRIAQLQRELEKANNRASEEQYRREEAENRALQEQHGREEEKRLREEEQRLREEEQRRREEAEHLSKRQNLKQYLKSCHALSLALDVVTDPTLTTQGDTTKPAGRIYPSRIIPWNNFSEAQGEIWEEVMSCNDFCSAQIFPSRDQVDYVKAGMRPVSSEDELRTFERETVENAVFRLIDQAYKDPSTRNKLDLKGAISFQSDTNLGDNETISESMEHVSIKTPVPGKTHRKARGKGNRADQFCICQTASGQTVPALAIEYKPPHKLSQEEIVIGLESPISPEHDVIHKDSESVESASKRLAAAVITQLFSYMVGRGVQYGYVCTGEAFVFLHIPDDPTIVYYAVCMPNLDVLDNNENMLHYTAVAQVFAFVVQSLRVEPPPASWHDKANELKPWDVEYDNVLSNTPLSVRKQLRESPYKPARSKNFKRSPYQTRNFCERPQDHPRRKDDEDPDQSGDSHSKPRSSRRLALKGTSSLDSDSHSNQTLPSGGKVQVSQTKRQSIQDRLFCTQKCLLGLVQNGPVDKDCPNSTDHGRKHISRSKFHSFLCRQLAQDRGRGADCVPLYIGGSRGALFKVRLSSHGYTLVAKGMEDCDLSHLQHEHSLYDRVQSIQGKHVPVCLGMMDLVLPYYYDSGVYWKFLLLSWAGRPLFDCINQIDKTRIINQASTAFKELHKLKIVHYDPEPRNILYDARHKTLMIVDLERAEFQGRSPLAASSGNEKHTAKRSIGGKKHQDPFAQELRSMVAHVSRCIGV